MWVGGGGRRGREEKLLSGLRRWEVSYITVINKINKKGVLCGGMKLYAWVFAREKNRKTFHTPRGALIVEKLIKPIIFIRVTFVS